MAIKICEFGGLIFLIEYVKPEEDCKNKGFFIVRKLQSIDDRLFENEEEIFKYLEKMQDINKEKVFNFLKKIK